MPTGRHGPGTSRCRKDQARDHELPADHQSGRKYSPFATPIQGLESLRCVHNISSREMLWPTVRPKRRTVYFDFIARELRQSPNIVRGIGSQPNKGRHERKLHVLSLERVGPPRTLMFLRGDRRRKWARHLCRYWRGQRLFTATWNEAITQWPALSCVLLLAGWATFETWPQLDRQRFASIPAYDRQTLPKGYFGDNARIQTGCYRACHSL